MRVKILIKVLIFVTISILVIRYIRRNILVVKSSSFENSEDSMILGSSKMVVPKCGNGMYAVAVKRGLIKDTTRTLHVGILRPGTFESQLNSMDLFFEKNKKWGASVFSVFSVGTTHMKSTLELMRSGILTNEYPRVVDILKKYKMVKFIGLAHGCRQPYIMIMNVKTGTVTEKTGFLGGKLTSKILI